jgi:integral membrane sensor domain MASE1
VRAIDSRRSLVTGMCVVGVAALYVLSARVGLLEHLVRDQVAPLWPPAGVALVCLLLLGIRAFPGIAIGALIVNIMLAPGLLPAFVMAAGSSLAALAAFGLLRQVGFRTQLDRLRDAVALVIFGAVVGPLISATVAASVQVLSGQLPTSEFWTTWSGSWTGDAMGVLIVVPLVLAIRLVHLTRPARPRRMIEVGLLLAGTLLVALASTHGPFDLLFLVFPFLIWAALRFRLTGAALCAVIVVTIAIHATAHGYGPFSGHGFFSDMVSFQAFDGSAALTALLLAAIITERDRAYREIETACAQLAAVVVRLDPGQRTGGHAERWSAQGDNSSESEHDGTGDTGDSAS